MYAVLIEISCFSEGTCYPTHSQQWSPHVIVANLVISDFMGRKSTDFVNEHLPVVTCKCEALPSKAHLSVSAVSNEWQAAAQVVVCGLPCERENWKGKITTPL